MLKEPYEANWLRVGCGQCSAVSMGACHLILTRLQPRRLPKAGREATRIPGEPLSALPPSTRNRGNIQGGFQERVGRVGRWVSHIFWRKVYLRDSNKCKARKLPNICRELVIQPCSVEQSPCRGPSSTRSTAWRGLCRADGGGRREP